MGAGTNVQKKLIALHHLDCPWRPADLQQREGRIIRQGNENKEVEIYTYVTENTFRISKIEDGSHYLDRTTNEQGEILISDLEPGVYLVKPHWTVHKR